jgi:hypothetical protein
MFYKKRKSNWSKIIERKRKSNWSKITERKRIIEKLWSF